jgi:hypothetical protein
MTSCLQEEIIIKRMKSKSDMDDLNMNDPLLLMTGPGYDRLGLPMTLFVHL